MWRSLADPVAAIERGGGWGAVVRREVLPLSADPHASAWYPNHFGHVVEGGSPPLAPVHRDDHGRRGRERGVREPGERGSASKVVDLYLFDPLGIALFSSDRVARFFARTLNARVWPAQASFALPSGELLNNVNNLVMKLDVLPTDDASVFFRTGLGAQLGATIHADGGLDWSVAIGSEASRHHVDSVTGVESVEIAWSSALYVDRNGSLLASLSLTRLEERAVTLNLYPGVVHDDFGAWANLTADGRLQLGLTSRSWLGAGLGFGL